MKPVVNLKAGKLPISATNPALWVDSMAEAIEVALNEILPYPFPTDNAPETRDRRTLFVVIAQGVVNHISPRIKKIAYARFDASAGGSGSVRLLPENDLIPKGSIVTEVGVDMLLVPSGTSATLGLTIEAPGDAQPATPVTGPPWSALGRARCAVTGWANALKLTDARNVSVDIVGDPGGGKFDVYVEYIEPAAS